ncbi:NAD-dependent epimerase/dehydratase family protein [Anaerobacillus alkaliphilus]|uniref:UDP-glucose 4-epimerase n=1 Tax=Anaerobacillus alkaliphilus TaxID=1548597 RepID=A0A4Q0VSX9_9BACI|nr:NAD-dependent epimerase/dehydratase family protein [Anaerobacillus alkaliphilus]RXJ00914.1 NAD-dependent epimerase/dehydratase family protein [Anaerobacillus alkaliphilus]
MNILVIGGTRFIGIHIVDELLRKKHKVTLFNRGKTNADYFPTVERIVGNRDDDLSMLTNNHWDAVIDTCGYVPRIVQKSATTLAPVSDMYVFVSSISVYRDFSQLNIDEQAEVTVLENSNTEEVTGETYGPLKALCEQEVEKAFPGRALIVRPGLIVGPYDSTDRFTYWPMRVARGGEVLAPGSKNAPVQFIDARDLAAYIVSGIEQKVTGIYNVTGPKETLTFEGFLSTCRSVLNDDVSFTWVDDQFLAKNEVGHWIEMPLYIPEAMSGMLAANIDKALSTGLSFTSLEKTIQDTYQWDVERNIPVSDRKAGLAAEKEAVVLNAYLEHKK